MHSRLAEMKRLMMILLILSLGCFLPAVTHPLHGQSGRLRKLLPSVQVSYLEWARDSRSFVYSLDSPTARDPFNSERFWTHYNLDTESFVRSSIYFFLPQLTSQEETVFVRTVDTFSYLSPDDRYLVYVGVKVLKGFEERYWQLVIGDRQTQTTYTFEYPLYDPFGKEEQFDVRWSQDSHSFVLVTCVDQFFCFPSVFIYVRGLESGLTGMVFDWEHITFPVVDGVEYRTLKLIDLSEDGTWALLKIGEDYGRGASHLMMYNTATPQSSFLITDPIGIVPQSFRFATPDGSQILYIDNKGIYRYDWANHTSTLLTTEVNNSKAKLGEFSPDGCWFVFVNSSRELYLFDLQGLPEAPTPTQPTSTSTPTLTLTPSFTPTLPAKFDKLRLFPTCSPDPATIRVWRVRNLNPFDLPFTWEVQGNREQGSGVARANGDTMFTTKTIHPTANVVRIFVQGKLQDVSTSTSTQCPTPTPGG